MVGRNIENDYVFLDHVLLLLDFGLGFCLGLVKNYELDLRGR